MMRRLAIVVCGIAAAFAVALPAWAGQASPHFIGTPTCTISSTGKLTCSGKAAGLDSRPATAFLTADRIVARYHCQNKGGNVAPGQPVATVPTPGPTQNITPHNGQITFNVSLGPPPTPTVKTYCPNSNWKLILDSITYYGAVVHIQQGDGTDVISFGPNDYTAPPFG
jgi:hypothetical protein